MILSRALLAALVCLPAPVSSASAQVSRVAFEPVVAADAVAGSTVPRSAGVWIDLFGAFRIAEGLDLVARPIFNRRTFDGEWQTQIYQLGLRYERPGDIGMRVEAGYMPSAIGLGLLENRPDINPVVSQHSSYYLPLPRADAALPRTFLIPASYPLGGQLTVSARRWDARVAIADSPPARGRPFLDAGDQPRMFNAVAGFGVTPPNSTKPKP